jgi:tetratricopeptide (TPR) repeat protein
MRDKRQSGRGVRASGKNVDAQRVPVRGIQGQGLQTGDGNAQLNDVQTAQPITAGHDVHYARRDIVINCPPSGQPSAKRIVVGSIPQAPLAFQLREGLLGRLRAAGPGTSAVYAITGLRGAGKTQVAAAYARECVNAGWRMVAWVNAETVPEVLAGLALIAAELGIGAGSADVESAGELVRWRLEADGEHCLVVFDNVTDVAALRRYIPAAGKCQVVLTSTSLSAAALGTPVAVDVFTAEESLAFLAARTGLADPAGAGEVAVELGGLPLALAQAAAVITAQGLTYPVYLERLRGFAVSEYLAPEDSGSYPRGLAEAVLLSVDAVTAADKTGLCASLLGVVALLSPAGVPRRVLHATKEASPAEIDDALGQLAIASLLTVGVGASLVTAHRLVMRVLRESRARAGTLHAAGRQACELLDTLKESLDEPWRDRPAALDFIQQVASLHRHLPLRTRREPFRGPDEEAQLAGSLAGLRLSALRCLNELKDNPGLAVEIGESLAVDCEKALGQAHPLMLRVKSQLAVAYREAGQYDKAIPLLESLVADREREEGESGPSTLTTRYELAVAHLMAGRAGEVIPLLENVLADRSRVSGESHENTVTARHALAVAYRRVGRAGEAIPLLQGVLADHARLLGDTHTDTLRARHELAVAYQAVGEAGEAVELLEVLLEDRSRLLGDMHPDTLATYGPLVTAYWEAGQTGKAIAMLVRSVENQARVQGETHPGTLEARHDLAAAYVTAGQADKAIAILEALLADRARAQGDSHPDTLETRHQLGVAYRNAGQADRAITILEAVLEEQGQLQGEPHPDMSVTRHNLAVAYTAAGRVTEAISLLEALLKDRSRAQGDLHPETLVTRHELAFAYWSAGQVSKAIARYELLLADQERVLGVSHPRTLLTRHNLALTYQGAGRVDEAISLYKAVLGGMDASHGPE